MLCLGFVHRQSFIPSFSFYCFFCFFFIVKAIALIAACSLSMGHVLGLKTFQTKYCSPGFMLDLGDVVLLLP